MDLSNHCEAEREVKPVKVYLKCSDCNYDLIFHKNVEKNLYSYKCLTCQNECVKNIKYPYIKYISKN
jgi:Zn finger protein HypA/HybF involved in hydrogenase expression